MTLTSFLRTLAFALVVVAPLASAGQTTRGPSTAISRQGVLDGARYRVEVPAGWNGGSSGASGPTATTCSRSTSPPWVAAGRRYLTRTTCPR